MSDVDRTNALESRGQIEASPDSELFTRFVRLVEDPDNRFVLALGGGSVPGLCGNVALLSLIEELGLREHVEAVWGTSAGAIAGGAWATGTPAREIRRIINGIDRRGAVDVQWPRIAMGLLGRPFGLRIPDAVLGGRHFLKAIRNGLRVSTFEETELPFRCIACTDDGRMTRKVFDSGPLLPAISASISLPGLLAPMDENGDQASGFFDGGLVEKTPMLSPIGEHQRLSSSRTLLLLCTHFGTEARRKDAARGFVRRFLASIYGLEEQLWKHQYAEARRQPNVTLLVVDPHLDDPSTLDLGTADRNYLQARLCFKRYLQNSKLALTLGRI